MSADTGRQARKLASRSSQAIWEPGPDRVGPLEVLARQDETRVPELVPVRYGRMLASAFTFYRGAAGNMAGAPPARAPRPGPVPAPLGTHPRPRFPLIPRSGGNQGRRPRGEPRLRPAGAALR